MVWFHAGITSPECSLATSAKLAGNHTDIKWITREKVKVDGVECPWFIKNFIDQQAEFIFVPGEQVETKAREFDATPFDIEGCELGHHGEDVSFNSILKEHNLTDPALLLGEIVRAADSHPAKPHAAGEGPRRGQAQSLGAMPVSQMGKVA